jgi:hypothetical protein
MEYGFRESSIELGSPAPFSVVNPEDAVQIIGGRPVTGPKTSGDTPGEKSESPGRRNAILVFPIDLMPQVSFSPRLRVSAVNS